MSKSKLQNKEVYEQRVRNQLKQQLTDINLKQIEHALGYSFKNKNLLRQAFLKSYIHVLSSDMSIYEVGNDTFEFIGDRALYTILTNLFFYTFKKESVEGYIYLPKAAEITKFVLGYSSNWYWSNIVNMSKNKFLKDLIVSYSKNIPKHSKVWADLFEAIFGAIALDSNFDIDVMCKSFLYIRFRPNQMGLLNRCKFEECLQDQKTLITLVNRLYTFTYTIEHTKLFS